MTRPGAFRNRIVSHKSYFGYNLRMEKKKKVVYIIITQRNIIKKKMRIFLAAPGDSTL